MLDTGATHPAFSKDSGVFSVTGKRRIEPVQGALSDQVVDAFFSDFSLKLATSDGEWLKLSGSAYELEEEPGGILSEGLLRSHNVKIDLEKGIMTFPNGTKVNIFRGADARPYVWCIPASTPKGEEAMPNFYYEGEVKRALVSAVRKSSPSNYLHQVFHLPHSELLKLENAGVEMREHYKGVNDFTNCMICLAGKSNAPRHPSRPRDNSIATEFGAVTYFDIFGKTNVAGISNFRGMNRKAIYYMFVFVDVHTQWITVRFGEKKTDGKKFVKEYYETIVAERRNGPIKPRLRSDNESVLQDIEIQTWLDAHFEVKQGPPYDHQSNGKVEVSIKTILAKARTHIDGSWLPQKTWWFAAKHAVYIMNRTFSKGLVREDCPEGDIPYRKRYGRLPNLKHLYTFGAPAVGFIPTKNRSKLDAAAGRYFYVGTLEKSDNTFMLWDADNKDAFFTFGMIKVIEETDDEGRLKKNVITSKHLIGKGEPLLNIDETAPVEVSTGIYVTKLKRLGGYFDTETGCWHATCLSDYQLKGSPRTNWLYATKVAEPVNVEKLLAAAKDPPVTKNNLLWKVVKINWKGGGRLYDAIIINHDLRRDRFDVIYTKEGRGTLSLEIPRHQVIIKSEDDIDFSESPAEDDKNDTDYYEHDLCLTDELISLLENTYGKFTMEACADDSGANSRSEKFCSPSNSFLEYRGLAQNMLVHPTTDGKEAKFISHFLNLCKHDDDMSGTVVLQREKKLHPDIYDKFDEVLSFPPGSDIFVRCKNGKMSKAARTNSTVYLMTNLSTNAKSEGDKVQDSVGRVVPTGVSGAARGNSQPKPNKSGRARDKSSGATTSSKSRRVGGDTTPASRRSVGSDTREEVDLSGLQRYSAAGQHFDKVARRRSERVKAQSGAQKSAIARIMKVSKKEFGLSVERARLMMDTDPMLVRTNLHNIFIPRNYAEYRRMPEGKQSAVGPI